MSRCQMSLAFMLSLLLDTSQLACCNATTQNLIRFSTHTTLFPNSCLSPACSVERSLEGYLICCAGCIHAITDVSAVQRPVKVGPGPKSWHVTQDRHAPLTGTFMAASVVDCVSPVLVALLTRPHVCLGLSLLLLSRMLFL